ncbi:MAG: flagellar hook-associated protein FlgL [Clostridiales bacterium]|nr:flagellar hook-associated protein FlgL [Clostridiales bacterium]
MRMTNKIMQNNSLYNINNNKVLQNKLSTQMSTQKKITRPSDDPVIAIRALRLRSDVSQITQYYGKNVPDAESWLKVTADALNTTTDVIDDMLQQCNKGSNKDLGVENLDIIVTQLKSLKDEFYATGNVDYAGRYIFTGYRTDTTLTYTENTTQDFKITEQINVSAIDMISYTSIGALKGISSVNYDPTDTGTVAISDTTIKNSDIHRIRLSYDDLKDGAVPNVKKVDSTTTPPTETDLFATAIKTMSASAAPSPYANPYEYVLDNPDEVVLIPETGELLIGENAYASISAVSTSTEIRVTYEKNKWEEGDLRPQHYFACTDQTTGVQYNEGYLTGEGALQIIQYDVGYNQKIRINTTADEVFTLDVDRNIDDLQNALAALKEIGQSKTNLDNMLKGMKEGETGYDKLKTTAEAADKAYTYIRENMQKMFEGLLTKLNGTLDNTSVAITDNGTRGSRLDLISNRLMNQKTTFQTLQSSNEDADITEVTIQLTSMNYSYQSALLATSKIMQNSLMNYI